MGTGKLNAGHTLRWNNIQGGAEILLVASCFGNRDKFRDTLGSYADFTLLPYLYPTEVSLALPIFAPFLVVLFLDLTYLTES